MSRRSYKILLSDEEVQKLLKKGTPPKVLLNGPYVISPRSKKKLEKKVDDR